jgi:hypothetical protein
LISGVLNQWDEIDTLFQTAFLQIALGSIRIFDDSAHSLPFLALGLQLIQTNYSIGFAYALHFADANSIPDRDDIDRDLESSLTLRRQAT